LTTPAPYQTPGDRREDAAITVGQVVADVYARAELAIIAALAKLARRSAAGAVSGQAAAAQLARTSTAVLTAAAEHTRATLDQAAAAVTAQVREQVMADLGAEAALQVGVPDTTTLAASLDGAITTAAGNVQATLTAATQPLPLPAGTGGAAPPPVPPSPPSWQPFRGEGDPYRYAVEGAIRDTRGGAPYSSLSYSRLQAAQKALDDLAAHGITGFTDKAGRNWDLATYVEMATRTAVSNMWDELQASAMVRSGIDLALIGTHSTEGSCPRCLPWLGQTISLTGATEGYPTYDEARATGFRHPNCFPGYVPVSSTSPVRASFNHWYDGDLVIIHTAGGAELPVTPNHPVATPEGWVAAGQLKVGQSVLRDRSGVERVMGAGPDDELIPARIGDVHEALRKASPVPAVSVPASAEQFHGDGGGSYVEVVLADSLLMDHWRTASPHAVADSALVVRDQRVEAFSRRSRFDQRLNGARAAAYGVMGGAGQRLPLLGAQGGHAAAHALAVADRPTVGNEDFAYRGSVHPESAANLYDGQTLVIEGQRFRRPTSISAPHDYLSIPELAEERRTADAHVGGQFGHFGAGVVALDQVVKIERRQFSGHVYNLQTADGWYAASGIIVHNCRCFIMPLGDHSAQDVTNPVAIGQAAEAYKASQRQRALERRVRAAGRRSEAAITPQARRRARQDLAAARAASAAHRQRHGLVMMKVTVQRRERPRGPR
jgi:Phage minor capsid protein 2